MTPKVTPKDFFLWLGAIVALYTSVISFITLYFQYINTAFPDPLTDFGIDPYSGSIRFAIASLLVFFPLFLLLMHFIRADISAVPEKADLWVRRWALYLTLFFAGLAMAVDFVTLIYTFLDGEVGTRFLYKVLVVFLVASALFMHFLADARGYWKEHVQKARAIAAAAAALVVLSIAAGFLIIGSPQDARAYRFDERRVGDLQSIQWQVLSHFQTRGEVPAALDELVDPLSGYMLPRDPVTGAMYEYIKIASTTFQLCATFEKQEHVNSQASASYPMIEKGDLAGSNWYHDAGITCYTRTIDPKRYPVTVPALPTK